MKALAIAVVLLIAACSNQQIYSAAQQHEQLECSKLPQGQFEECMRKVDESYDDYTRAREEVLQEDKK